MTRNQREKLIELINKHGIYESAKLLGMSLPDLVLKSKMEFNHEVASSLILNLGVNKKLPNSYKEFKLHYISSDDLLEWTLSNQTDYFGKKLYEDVNFFATPFWDGSTYIPVELTFYTLYDNSNQNNQLVHLEFSGEYFTQLKSRTQFDGLEDLLTWYKHFYLPRVYDILTEDFLPKIRKEAQSFLK